MDQFLVYGILICSATSTNGEIVDNCPCKLFMGIRIWHRRQNIPLHFIIILSANIKFSLSSHHLTCVKTYQYLPNDHLVISIVI